MSDNFQFEKVLDEILKTPTNPALFEQLSQQEKTSAAKLLLQRIEARQGIALEELATSLQVITQLDPANCHIWLQKGLIFAKRGAEADLVLASDCFSKATTIDPQFFSAWYAWASTLVQLGTIKGQLELLYESDQKFEVAEKLLPQTKLPQEAAQFYWHWGHVIVTIGKVAGEPNDLKRALGYYSKAKELGLTDESYYVDFASLLVEFAILVGREDELFADAITLYEMALPEIVPDPATLSEARRQELSERYFQLATCYHVIFSSKMDRHTYHVATNNFMYATTLYPDMSNFWLQWGLHTYFAAKLWQDVDFLRSGLEKLTTALRLAPNDLVILSCYANSLAELGFQEEIVSLLKKAEALVRQGLEIAPKHFELTYVHIRILVLLGRYFQDEKYLQNAIEKVEAALHEHSHFGPLWHQLAGAKFFLGELIDDTRSLMDADTAFRTAATSDLGRFGYFWNEWGVALLGLAEHTGEKKYLVSAEEKFERSIILHDTVQPEWFYNYGCVLDFLGDLTDDELYFERAISAFHAALSMQPDYLLARLRLAISLTHFAECMDDVDVLQEAHRQFEIVLKDDPEDDIAWLEWGQLYIFMQQMTGEEEALNKAEEAFLQALQLGNEAALYSLACLYSIRGVMSESLHYLEKAIEQDVVPSLEMIFHDEWLAQIRKTPSFEKLMQKYNSKNSNDS